MYDLENKTRQIVAEMLLSMNDRLVDCMRESRAVKVQCENVNHKLTELNSKSDREAKIKDLVHELKTKVNTIVSCSKFLLNNHFRRKTCAETSRRLSKTMKL